MIKTGLTRSPDLSAIKPDHKSPGRGFVAAVCDARAGGPGGLISRTYQASVGSLISNLYLPASRLRTANSPLAFRVEPKPPRKGVITWLPLFFGSSRDALITVSISCDARLSHLSSRLIGSSVT